MKRREFVALLGGAAAWPLAARAEQAAVPVIGFLSGRSQDEASGDTAAFHQGLTEMGYVAGRNVVLEYRWAEGRKELLPDLAADLVRRQVAVLAAVGGNNSAFAAIQMTSVIPIVFTSSADSVQVGLVASLSHPGGNVTGVSWFDTELGSKQLQLLSDLVPNISVVVLMVNPDSPEVADQRETAQKAARDLGWKLHVSTARSVSEIEVAFATAKRQAVDAVMISSDPFLHSRRQQVVALISYGNSIADAYRRAGLQTGRLLRGVKPTDLPVDRSTKFELTINLTTAKTLGLTVPDKLLVAADEVIE
jgi:putative ABC transport system substrate-binding protein